jgi:hypothetical protein
MLRILIRHAAEEATVPRDNLVRWEPILPIPRCLIRMRRRPVTSRTMT